MNKLTKTHIKERDEIANRLRDRRDDLDKAVDAYVAVTEEAWTAIQSAMEEYNEVVTEANEWRDNIATEISDDIADRSEKWQESDKCQATESWKSEYETEIDAAELEQPDALDFDLEDAAELLEQLPEEAQ